MKIASATPQADASLISDKASKITRTKPNDGVKLFVGMPLDTVSKSNTINHARAISAGLKALKLLGVDGVELPVWWGIAENEIMGKYEWTAYLAVVEMVQKLGLKLHVSLCFHASQECKIPLPEWVSRNGEVDPNIYFMDRLGQQYKDCLSLAVDDVPVLDGKTRSTCTKSFARTSNLHFHLFGFHYHGKLHLFVYCRAYPLVLDQMVSFDTHLTTVESKAIIMELENSSVTTKICSAISSSMLKNTEILYGDLVVPMMPRPTTIVQSRWFFHGKRRILGDPIRRFFLSWYSNQLISHGDRILSLAASAFKDASITVSAKVPLMHSWYKTRSHPSELTAGFYNTAKRDGYDDIAKIFSQYSCKMILPGMDLSDEFEQVESRSSPESLLAQITSSCRTHGVEMSGQNSLVSGVSKGLKRIRKNLMDENAVADLFMYQRMGAYFFSPEHFSLFAQFVRGLNQPIQSLDDLTVEKGDDIESILVRVSICKLLRVRLLLMYTCK
ncbi:hypothetical protein DH2020_020010 [Rehmannia glutinosa]|uniref:Beta-amylase n=1 Tax=Rehmannia glutinosa TaxID=99300 RepID=A0ABR0WH25_REHGL